MKTALHLLGLAWLVFLIILALGCVLSGQWLFAICVFWALRETVPALADDDDDAELVLIEDDSEDD
jgi:hypothetical protein